MARVLDEDELIGIWTLVGDELEQLSGRRGATKLGFALLLRFYAVHGRFPAGRGEIPDQVVAHVAALEEQRNGEWRYLEFLQVRSWITAGMFMREIPGGTRATHRSRPVDLPEHRY